MTHLLAAEGPNGWLLPADINEVYWGTVSFLILAALFLWKGLPKLKEAMAARSEGIRDDLAAAERAEHEAAASRAEQEAQFADADGEAERIVADARDRAAVLKTDLMKRAEADVTASKQRARAEIEASRTQVLAELRSEVAQRTVRAAEAVAVENLDDTAKNDLIEQYIQQVGARS